jgi:release factor glutamine methyltransferase
LGVYRTLAPEILRLLRSGGRFLLEVGLGQAGKVRALLEGAGAIEVETHLDLSGGERVVAGAKSF